MGCPDPFLIRTHRERLIPRGFVKAYRRLIALSHPRAQVVSSKLIYDLPKPSKFGEKSDPIPGAVLSHDRFGHCDLRFVLVTVIRANDDTLLVGGFRVLPIENHLAKLC